MRLGFGEQHLLVTRGECEQGGDLRTGGGHGAEFIGCLHGQHEQC